MRPTMACNGASGLAGSIAPNGDARPVKAAHELVLANLSWLSYESGLPMVGTGRRSVIW